VHCAGGGVVVALFSHKQSLWFGYKAVRIRVNKKEFYSFLFGIPQPPSQLAQLVFSGLKERPNKRELNIKDYLKKH
jgi:hypothetical protein